MPKVADPSALGLGGGPRQPAPTAQPGGAGYYESAVRSPGFQKEVTKVAARNEAGIQQAAQKGVMSADSLRGYARDLKSILSKTPTGPGAMLNPALWENLSKVDVIGGEQLFSSGKLDQMKGSLSDSDRNWLRSLGPSSKKWGNSNLDAANAMEWMASRQEAYDQEKIRWERKYGSIQVPNENGQSFNGLFLKWAEQKIPRPILMEDRVKAAQQNNLGRVISVRPVSK